MATGSKANVKQRAQNVAGVVCENPLDDGGIVKRRFAMPLMSCCMFKVVPWEIRNSKLTTALSRDGPASIETIRERTVLPRAKNVAAWPLSSLSKSICIGRLSRKVPTEVKRIVAEPDIVKSPGAVLHTRGMNVAVAVVVVAVLAAVDGNDVGG